MAGEENSTVGVGESLQPMRKTISTSFMQKDPYCVQNFEFECLSFLVLLHILECVCLILHPKRKFHGIFFKISEKNFHCSPFDILLNWIIKSIPNSENNTALYLKIWGTLRQKFNLIEFFFQWTNGPMDKWNNGLMDQWTNGPMDQWTDGKIDQWTK